MITVETSKNAPYGERHLVIEISEEGAEYLADVLERHEFYDAGAMDVVRSIREHLDREKEPK